MKHIGRKLTSATQKVRGRNGFKYEFELIPYFVGELPAGVDRALFAWERGNKLFVTEAESVNPNTRAVFWKQYLKQTTTVYWDDATGFMPKDYAFKVQTVKKKSNGEEDRKTIGKIHVDLAQFCTDARDPEPQEVYLQLKPHGKLKISIKATWLPDAKFDDGLTEGGRTEWTNADSSRYDDEEEEVDEQDLSGFEHVNGGSRGRHGNGEAGEHDEHQEGDDAEQRARRKRRKHRKRRSRMQDQVPEGEYDGEDGDGGEGGGGGGGGHSSQRRGHGNAQPSSAYDESMEQMSKQVRAEMELREGQNQTTEVFCCCFPRRGRKAPDPLEQASLLSGRQAVEMQRQNKL